MQRFLLIGLILTMNPSVSCPISSFANLTVQSNFNLHEFLGTWYEIKWYKNQTELDSEIWNDFSQTFQFANNSNEHLLALGNARLPYEKECSAFRPWLIITNNGAKMTLEKMNIDSPINLNWPYYILQTDYHHYALIYGCMSENYTLTDLCLDPMLWVFGRTVLLPSEYLIEVDHYIANVLCMNLSEIRIGLHSTKSCHVPSSWGGRRCLLSGNMYLSLLILYFFLTYK